MSTVLSVAVRQNDSWILKALEELAVLERTSKSQVVTQALKEFIEKHKENPPQQTLTPRQTPYINPVVEAAKDRIAEMEDLVKANPGTDMTRILALFRKQTGTRKETGVQYLKTLRQLGLVLERSSKLYHKEQLQGGPTIYPGWFKHIKGLDHACHELFRELEKKAPEQK